MHISTIEERRHSFDQAREYFQRFESLSLLLSSLEAAGVDFSEAYQLPSLQPRLHAYEVIRLLTSESLNKLDGLLASW